MHEPLRVSIKDEAKRIGYGPLAEKLDVSKGALWKFCNTDYVPQSEEIRRKLGIPEPEIIPHYRDPLGRFVKR